MGGMEEEQKTIDVICKEKNDCYRRTHKGKLYCIGNQSGCPEYDNGNTIEIPRKSFGWLVENKGHDTFHLCRRM